MSNVFTARKVVLFRLLARILPLPSLLIFPALMVSSATVVFAADKSFEKFGDYKVFYSVFNSSFIKPDIARLHNITRGKDHALINIAIIKGNKEGGVAAKLKGTASNLMQQQRSLGFFEIQEQDAVYYLAPLRFTDEEVLNFSITVRPNDSARSYTLKFTKTLYVDN